MAYLRDFTTSATQAADVYTDLAALMTASGWVQQGADITDGSFTWRVWRNPAVNSGLGKDFHVGIGIANSGTGSLLFRLFEDLVGGSRIQRPAPAENFTLGAATPDAYGDLHHATSTALFPVPWTPGTGAWASADPNADYSVAAWGQNGQTSASSTEQALIAAAPPEMDLRSAYVAEISQQCDDSTAVEYVLHVSAKAFTIATKLVFNTVTDWLHVGAYEPLSLYDTVPVVLMNPVEGSLFFTRNWEYVDLPFSHVVRPGGVSTFSSSFAPGAFGRTYGTITQTPSSVPSQTDWAWRGVLGTRLEVHDGQSTSVVRGVAHDMVVMPPNASGGIPPIDFGDESSINGAAHTLIRPATSGTSLWVPQS